MFSSIIELIKLYTLYYSTYFEDNMKLNEHTGKMIFINFLKNTFYSSFNDGEREYLIDDDKVIYYDKIDIDFVKKFMGNLKKSMNIGFIENKYVWAFYILYLILIKNIFF